MGAEADVNNKLTEVEIKLKGRVDFLFSSELSYDKELEKIQGILASEISFKFFGFK